MNQKLKRLGLAGIAFLVFSTLLFPMFRLQAAPGLTQDEELSLEYKNWHLVQLITTCTDGDFNNKNDALHLDDYGKFGKDDPWDNKDVSSGGLFATMSGLTLEDNEFACEGDGGLKKLAEIGGFNNLSGLNGYLFPKEDASGNPRRKSGNSDLVPLADDLQAKMNFSGDNREKTMQAMGEYLLDKLGKGFDKDYALSPAARFWYYKVTLKNECKGEVTDDYGRYSDVSNNNHEPENISDNNSASRLYWGATTDGTAKKFKYVVMDLEASKGKNIEEFDGYFTSGNFNKFGESDQPWLPDDCVDLVNRFKENYMETYLNAYIKMRDDKIQECLDAGTDRTTCESDNPLVTNPEVPTPDGDTSSDIETQCSVSKNPLSWIMCPLIEGFNTSIEALDKQINSMLTINTESYFKDEGRNETAAGFRSVWVATRTIAISFLVIIGLVMVIGTAIGVGVFDAYTVKKLFPRIVAAIVIVSVSWPLVIFLIDASNSLGLGIRYMIQAPFKEAFDTPVKVSGGQLSIGALGAVALSYSLGLVGILSMIASALLAVLIAFLVLVFRELLIILLAVIAPVAIVAYILPNTQKAGKLWWDFFSKALLAFPIISGIIAIGRVFAVVSQNAGTDGGNSGTVRGFIAFVAYFGPYFILPQAFKMAGGAIGNLSGIVNDRGKGVFDRLRKTRQNQTSKNWEATRAGNRFKGGTESNFRGRMNRRLEMASRANEAGLNPTRWGTKLRNATSDATEAHLEDAIKHSNFGIWSGDDEKLWAARGNTRQEVEALLVQRDPGRFAGRANAAERDRAVEQIMTAKRQMGAEAFSRARIRAQAKTGTGYQFEDANGNKFFDASAMIEDINEAYGDDRNGAGKALAEMRTSLANSGQVAGLAGYGTWAKAMGDMYSSKVRAPGETQAQFESRYEGVRQKAHDNIMEDTLVSVAPGQALYGKPTSAAALGHAHAKRIQAIADEVATGARPVEDLSVAVANAAGIYDAMAQASPNNANAMAETLMSVQLNNVPLIPVQEQVRVPRMNATGTAQARDPGTKELLWDTQTVSKNVQANTVREFIQAQMGSNPKFVDRRRDYSAATWQQAQQAQAMAAGVGGPGAPGGPVAPGPTAGGTFSDKRLKRNIGFVDTVNGIRLYKFQYLWSNQVYIGVMAQDLIYAHPEALTIDQRGYYRVSYDALGLRMMTLEEWELSRQKNTTKLRSNI